MLLIYLTANPKEHKKLSSPTNMFKTIIALAVVALASIAVSATSTNSAISGVNFSSPAAESSWKSGANMSGISSTEVATSSARSILQSQNLYSSPDGQYYPYGPSAPTGTYNCTSGCSRTCSYTCSTNYRCR